MEKTNRALLIGINYKGTSGALQGCIADTENVKAYLKEKCGDNVVDVSLDKDEIKKVTKETWEVVCLNDNFPLTSKHYPSKHNILNAFQWLLKGKRQIFHFSGHGTQVKDLNGDEKDGMDEAIVPADYNKNGIIIDDDIRILLIERVPAESSLKCIFDCCHSGTAADLPYEYGDVANKLEFKTKNIGYPIKGDVVMWSGSRDAQTSADAYIDGGFAGAMTANFLKLLRDPKRNKSYRATYESLLTVLQQNKYKQKPQLSSSQLLNLEDTFDLI